jgi:hypothetical protein
MKKHKGITLYTKMLKRKVRLLSGEVPNQDEGRAGVVVNVYLIPAGVRYTVILKDGRLVERAGQEIVVER